MKKSLKFFTTILNIAVVISVLSVTAQAKGDDIIKKGVFIGNVDVSGMTREEATEAVNNYISEAGNNVITVKSLGVASYEVSVSELNPTWANEEVIDEAFTLGKKGNIISRYKEIKDLEINNKIYDMEFNFDDSAVVSAIREEGIKGDQPAIRPTMRRENGAFIVDEGQAGYITDVDASIAEAKEVLASDWNLENIQVDMVGTVDEPEVNAEDLKQVKDLLGTFTTSYKSSGADRSANVANGAAKINGSVVFPGEEFSTYNTVKPFSADNGYHMAGSYLNGTVVDSMGGGICQVSTTLYNAVLRAELEVVERNNHSMIVSYVKVSEDAAIAESAGKDFRFVNNYDFPIYIEGITQDKQITFNIYGVETRPSNRKVEFVSETTETIQPQGEIVTANGGAPIGSISVTGAHIGYKGRLWKVVYVDGVEQSREQINSSSYKPAPRSAIVGVASDDPYKTEAMMAAVSTQNIDHCKGIAAQLLSE